MNAEEPRPRCPGCGRPFAPGTAKATGWDRSPWSDEYADMLYQCAGCGAWSIVTVIDRFTGPAQTTVRGPLSDEEAAEQLARLKE